MKENKEEKVQWRRRVRLKQGFMHLLAFLFFGEFKSLFKLHRFTGNISDYSGACPAWTTSLTQVRAGCSTYSKDVWKTSAFWCSWVMTMWRTWHVRNEITHSKPAPSTEASRRFLSSYIDSLLHIRQHPEARLLYLMITGCVNRRRSTHQLPIPYPRSDGGSRQWWNKLNVDGSFVEADGSGGAGMILRNHSGEIIYASCRQLLSCTSALVAELSACREGVAPLDYG